MNKVTAIKHIGFVLAFFVLSSPTSLTAQTFTEVGTTTGVNDPSVSKSGSWADFDNDGDLDLYVTNETANRLYRNNAGVNFTDIALSAGVDLNGNQRASAWGDFDNDGDLDLYVANRATIANNPLYRNNGNNTFTDIGSSAGVDDANTGIGVAWGDYDNDGDLDLYLTNGLGASNKLFQNNGNSTFSDVSISAGLNDAAWGQSVAWGDFDNDGDLDLFRPNSQSADILYRNNGSGTFSNITGSVGLGDTGICSGASWGDYDNDGDLDLYVTKTNVPSLLYQNNNGINFTNVASSAGVTSGGDSRGIAWGDYDNDGDLDLYVNNDNGNNHLYQNTGSGTFTDVAGTENANDGGNSIGVSWADYDNDGDLDLYVANGTTGANKLFQNGGNSNRWLQVTLTGVLSQRDGIGAQVTAVTGSNRQRQDIDGGTGYQSQESLSADYGFGATTTVDSLIIVWPSGITQILTNVSTNQQLSVTESGGAITFSEIAATVGVNGSGNSNAAAWGDFDGDNDLDLYHTSNVGTVNRLYRNDGSIFNEIASSAGVASASGTNSTSAVWGDYNNDGDLDLYVSRSDGGANHLFDNNGSGVFTDRGTASGTASTNHHVSAAWGDYNNDGQLDIYITGQAGTGKLYRNEGGTLPIFSDQTTASAVANSGASFSASWGDFDNDNDLDLYLTATSSNQLFRNDGSGSFNNIATSAGVNDPQSSFVMSWADYDNDGDLDIYVVNSGSANNLFRNDGNETFANVTSGAGVGDTGTYGGGTWADYDNDGDLDLFVTQGQHILYRNNNDGTFINDAANTGLTSVSGGNGAPWGDYDNDGDLDLYVAIAGGNNQLFRNNGNANRWLNITTVGTISNKSGIGAQVTVVTGSTRRRNDVSGGTGYYSHSSLPVEFGFGGTATIDSIIVHWPSGLVTDTTNVAANQFITMTEFATVSVLIPDTVAAYSDTTLVPIRIISDVTGLGIVAAEICIAYDNTVVTPGAPDNTELTGSLVATGWSVEDNIFPGTGNIDTLSIAMSTAQDTLSGLGDLVYLVFKTTASRQPDSTALEITKILFNDGDPSVSKQDGSLKLIGSDGAIVATPGSINPGDIVTITVTDADFDLDVGSPDQVSATAISKLYNDSQSVTLTETGNNTGVFTNTVNTIFSLSAGPSNDGVITTIAGDSICVSYVDSLTSAGTTLTRQDTVEVIGGSDGVVQASYVVQALDGRNGVRDTVRVQITDADLDTDVGVAEQVSATITNAISGEIEAVTLTETAVSSGIFQVRVPSVVGASGTNNNGELSLASWDTLNVSYTDALTAQGGSAALLDTTRVVNLFGDVRVNDQVQAFDAARLLAISVGLISSNTQTTLVGDVDGGGTIQAFDASLVLQYVVRLINRFPVQLDFTDDPKNHPFEKPVPLDQIIALGELQIQGDDTYLLPIHLGEREGILSGTLTLGLDPGIEILDVTPATGYSSFMTAHNASAQDVLRIAFAGSQSDLSGSGDVIILHLRSKGDYPIRLSLDQVALNGQNLTPTVNIEAIETVEAKMQRLVTDLYRNVPNPFNPQTTIRYDLSQAGQVNLVIYSITGQRIRTLVSEYQAVGSYQIIWDGKDAFGHDVSSGVYLMRMNTRVFAKTQKMLLLR